MAKRVKAEDDNKLVVVGKEEVVNEAVVNACLPSETPADFEKEMAYSRQRYGPLFKDDTQFEYFTMLPIPEELRDRLAKDIVRAKASQQKQQDFSVQ